MAGPASLDNVVRALHNAVIEAQKLTEQQHIRQLKRYFDEETGMPDTQKIQVPDLRPDAENKWRTIEVPKMALSPPSAIQIKDLSIQFRASLIGFVHEHDAKTGFLATERERPKKEKHAGPINVEFGSAPKATNFAEISITFEHAEPPEAYHRIAELLNKTVY
jgi:hypothetical protein